MSTKMLWRTDVGGLDLTHRSTRYLGACDEGVITRHLGEGEGKGKEMGIKQILPQLEALQCRLRE